MMKNHFDAVVVGTGQAGCPLAERMAREGLRVAIVERGQFGGTCVNTGCIPTKAMVASAHVAWTTAHAHRWGVVNESRSKVDLGSVIKRKNQISGDARADVERWVRGIRNVTVLQGHARFIDAFTISVGDADVVSADKIFLNVGGRASVPRIAGLETIEWLTNSSVMQLDRLPRHLVVIGGSYVGLEFAQMFRRFGSDVTVLQRGSQLIPREDPDIAAEVHRMLQAEGIGIRLNAECVRVARDGSEVLLELGCDESPSEIRGTHVLVATGRTPNTDDLGLDRADVEVDARGYIKVDESLRTKQPHIWALGDCNGRGAFTHTAWNDYEVVAANLFDGADRRVSDRVTSYALFTDPPLGRIGLTETEVRARGRPALIGKRPMSRVGRAVQSGQTTGFIKVVADATSLQILGASILGLNGDEAVQSLLDLVAAKAPYTDLLDGVRIHPTVSELIPTALQSMVPLEQVGTDDEVAR